MRITVCGSVAHAKQLVELHRALERLGHEPVMHEEMFAIADGTAKELVADIAADHAAAKRKHDFIRWWYEAIKGSDAILVGNFAKNGVAGYVGGNTLMEIGFAHVLGKRVFLLNPVPALPYADEIKAMADVVLGGDLGRIGQRPPPSVS